MVKYPVLIFLVIAVRSVSTALGCSCLRSGAVDVAFKRADNVVVLKARSIERTEKEQPALVTYGGYGGIKQTTLTVEKVYKGSLKVGQELIFAQGGGGDCIWTFTEESIGQEFLFYLGAGPLDGKSSENVIAATGQFPTAAPKNIWTASTCSRSGGLKYRSNDIKYLDNRSKVAGKTRLSGQLSQRIDAATEEGSTEYRFLENYKVKVTGNGKNLELKTDEFGGYEVYGLPPGKYKVAPEAVEGYGSYDGEQVPVGVEIKAGQHTEQDFFYVIRNAVRGRLFDTNGKPLNNVCLDLIPTRGKPNSYVHLGDCTNADGSFEFKRVPAGSYHLMVNEGGRITATEPFGTFYYPSAVRREDASEITIAPGQFRENLIVTAPTTAEVIEVTGVVLFENGKPAASDDDEPFFVQFFSADDVPKEQGGYAEADSQATTDKNGRFRIRVLKGQVGSLFGKMITYEGEYENCSKLDRLIRSQRINVGDIRSAPVRIEATSDITGIELKFPFPSCKKKRIE